MFTPAIDIFCAEVDLVLNDIEQNMKNVKTVQAKFIQNKKMAMFDMPVTIKGKLYIENPDMFSWVVIEPIEYTLIITDDTVKLQSLATGTGTIRPIIIFQPVWLTFIIWSPWQFVRNMVFPIFRYIICGAMKFGLQFR